MIKAGYNRNVCLDKELSEDGSVLSCDFHPVEVIEVNVLMVADPEEYGRFRYFLELESEGREPVWCFFAETCCDARKMVSESPYLYDLIFIGRKITDLSEQKDAEEIRSIYAMNPRILITMSVSKTFLSYDFCSLPSICTLKHPVSREMVRSLLKQVGIIEKIRSGNPFSRLPVIGRQGVTMIPAASVRYARKVRNGIMMVTEYGEMMNRRKMDDFEENAGNLFLRCHSSYIVNLSHLVRLQRNTLKMDDGESIPVSRSYQRKVRRYLERYVAVPRQLEQ